MPQPLLYKYRSLLNFKNFVDIILRNRLYAAVYKEMNDPMEGQYYYTAGEYNRGTLRSIRENKQNLRVCSLSRNNHNELMWSHYSDGHRGVAIGVEVDRQVIDVRPVIYEGLHNLTGHIAEDEAAREILSHKLNFWSYEEEERAFTTNGIYIPVNVQEVITGRVMSTQDLSLVRDLVKKINPTIRLIRGEDIVEPF